MTDIETVQKDASPQEESQPVEDAPKKKHWWSKKEKPKKTPKQELIEWVVTLAAAVVIALLVREFLFEPVRVDGRSMAETLTDGEVMFVTKMEYLFGGDPERFDVVICHYPDRGNTNFVKRVVGLPGDTVMIADGYLYVNGEKYEEEYLTYRPDYYLAPYTVPEGCYFVLGDNRSNSNDSHIIGPITRDMIVGHVRSVILPLSNWRTIE